MELFKAHNQWKNRPVDERFKSVQEMHAACEGYRESASKAEIPYSALRVEAMDGDIKLVGKTGVPATLTHWSMGQICQQAGAPAGYIRELPATLAAQNINHGLKERPDQDAKASLLFHKNGSLVLRGSTSTMYKRIWNSDITKRLLNLQASNPNWKNPMAYKVVAPGANGQWPTFSQEMEPAGLYASDHDMFAFLVDESKTLDGSPQGLNRGFFTWNSEVGGSSFGFMAFLYDRVCGNNIVWGAKDVFSLKIRHVGQADDKAFRELAMQLVKYTESSTGQIEKMIKKARSTEMGNTSEEILDNVFALAQKVKAKELTQNRISDAIETAQKRVDRYGNPNTLWAVVSGLTENSQFTAYADERSKIDQAAGKLLNVIEF
jgi:Domain of unknown function (DUF932)